ncbi:STAS/SEC14 domain-containing protein [Bacteroidota bacterium]
MDEHLNYKIWWDKENNVARAWAKGDIDEFAAEAFLKATKEIAEKHGPKVNWLHDLSEIKIPKAKARKNLAVGMADPSVNRCAVFGASVFLKTVAGFIAAAGGQKNIRYFATEKEALNWLKGRK